MKTTARLIVTYECDKHCAGCCNQWHPVPPPIQRLDYEEIVITGGEPMLFPNELMDLLHSLRSMTHAKLYLYTARMKLFMEFSLIADCADGVTLSLHNAADAEYFDVFSYVLKRWIMQYQGSFRLHVFPNAGKELQLPDWIHPHINLKFCDWIINCPVPKHEELVRLHKLWTRV